MSKVVHFLAAVVIAFGFTSCEHNNKPGKPANPEKKEKVLRLSSNEDPDTLDPRLSRSLVNITFIKMFYEGLVTQDKEGEIVPAVAKEYEISANGKSYTFRLRECYWCNGDPITAGDFAAAWKSLLDPAFPAPMAYQFYMIKGAKEAKEGLLSLDEVGISAVDEKTLVVDLVEPTPYFLELLTMNAFCPVHQEWAKDTTKPPVTNGPFNLEKWVKSSEVLAVKNPKYWDAEHVYLDKIDVLVLEENTALQMFQAGELDWAGSPLSTIPTDAKVALKENHQLLHNPAAGTHFFCFNTLRAPFDNVKIRKALSMALNRTEIVDHITQGNQIPATGFVPISYGLQMMPYFEDNNIEMAKALFQEGLEEVGCSAEEFPRFSISYASNELNNKIAQAVEQQWKEVLGVELTLDQCESKVYYDRLAAGDFVIGIKSWYGDFRDPINFLEVFKSKTNRTNNTQWENKLFTDLLNLSTRVSDKNNRMNILRRAEKILVTEMPVAPLYYNCYNYVKKENVKDVFFCDLGYLDFKHAVVE